MVDDRSNDLWRRPGGGAGHFNTRHIFGDGIAVISGVLFIVVDNISVGKEGANMDKWHYGFSLFKNLWLRVGIKCGFGIGYFIIDRDIQPVDKKGSFGYAVGDKELICRFQPEN